MENKSSNPPVLRFILIFVLLFGGIFGSISNQTNRIGPFIPAGLPATLSVTFPYQNASDLLVLDLGQGGTTRDPPVVLTLNSDYTVTGGGYNASTQMQSGNVVVVSGGAHSVLANDYIVILRNTPLTQTTVFSSTGILTGPMIEKALDKGITASQQLTEASGRSLRFEAGETVDGTMVKSSRAGKLLGFDAFGNVIYSGSSGGGGTTYTAGTGLLLSSNAFSVNPAQALTSLTVTNPITGGVTGNAGTATILATPRAINGVNFDGSAAITVPAAAATLAGASLAAGITAAPGLLSTSVGTLGSMAIQTAGAVNITGGTVTGATVTGLPAPSATTDAATKAYVDSISAGIVPRSAVVVATTANITLSGTQTIDGQAVIAGNRVLVKNQTLSKENGIYDCAAGAWARSSDSNTAGKLLFGYYYFVSSGSAQGATSWFIQTAPAVLNTDPVVFAQFSASQSYSAGTGLGLSGNVFSLNSAQSGITFTGSAFNGTVGPNTPNTGLFTTLGASSLINSTITGGKAFGAGSATTANIYFQFQNSGGTFIAGVESSGGGSIITGAPAYDTSISGASGLSFSATNTASTQMRLTSSALTANVPYAINSNANLRTTKGNFHLTVNVKDYGATGDGSTDDTAAINSAVAAAAAIGSNITLFFPAGNYHHTGINTFSGFTNLLVHGEGAMLYQTTNANNTFVFDNTCTQVTVRGIWFNGVGSARANGIHIRMQCSHGTVENCRIERSSDFGAFFDDTSTTVTDSKFISNTVINTCGDGVHLSNVSGFLVANNIFYQCGDDAIAPLAGTTYLCKNGVVSGNYIYGRTSALAGASTDGHRGIAIQYADTVLVYGNNIYNTKSTGIEIADDAISAIYNTRITVRGNSLYGCNVSAGSLGSIEAYFTKYCDISDNHVISPASGSGIAVADFVNLSVGDNYIETTLNQFCRGIVADTATSYSGRTYAATWTDLFVTGNRFVLNLGSNNEAIYMPVASSKTISKAVISENKGDCVGGWITLNYFTTVKVVNNTAIGSSTTVTTGANTTGATTANNN